VVAVAVRLDPDLAMVLPVVQEVGGNMLEVEVPVILQPLLHLKEIMGAMATTAEIQTLILVAAAVAALGLLGVMQRPLQQVMQDLAEMERRPA
jgi:hypothetical protein